MQCNSYIFEKLNGKKTCKLLTNTATAWHCAETI